MRRLAILILLSFCLVSCSQASEQPPATATTESIPYEVPSWFEGAILYEIFVRSFADSDGDGTGDLEGIRQRLDYIQSLSVDAIWLMPIYPSPSVHGYDVTDYTAVNPDYGSHADLVALVEDAHSRGIRVILDFVPSHLSNHHPHFQHALGNPDSIWSDWFAWTNESHTAYASFAGLGSMPRFNHYNPEVVDFLVEAALFWLDLDQDGDLTDGIDGFRVDNVTFPPNEFLETFRHRIKEVNPEALLLGEAWVHSARDISLYFPGKFDALFDFPLFEILQGDHGFNGDGLLAGRGHPTLINSLMKEETERFPEGSYVVRFMANHDTNRMASEMKGSLQRQKLAASLLSALPGPIMLYYGEEIGMLGEKGGAPHWDSYRREPMDWYSDQVGDDQTTWFDVNDPWNIPGDGISVEEHVDKPDSLLNLYRYIFDLRQQQPALKFGGFEPIELKSDGVGGWGFQREFEGEVLIAIFNFSDEELRVTVPNMILESEDLFSSTPFDITTSLGGSNLDLPATTGLLFRQSP